MCAQSIYKYTYVCWCVQVQATVVGFLASIAAVIFGWIPEGHFKMGHAVLLCASSVATAFIASLLLGTSTTEGISDIHRVELHNLAEVSGSHV